MHTILVNANFGKEMYFKVTQKNATFHPTPGSLKTRIAKKPAKTMGYGPIKEQRAKSQLPQCEK